MNPPTREPADPQTRRPADPQTREPADPQTSDFPKAVSHLENVEDHRERLKSDPEKASRLQKMAEELGSELSQAEPTDSKDHPPTARRLELDPQKVEHGLAKLVLTLINLLRKLMERQAIRRMEQGTLTEAQMERSGQAFKRLDQKIEELKKQFGLADEDLNLDLGPLGELM